MDIFIFNVQFGECCLLKEGNENLLVDFGSDSPDKSIVLSTVTVQIQNLCKDQPLSVVLTHFHEDHINGLTTYLNDQSSSPANIPFRFQTFYIPDIFAQNTSNATINFIHLLLLKDIFDAIIVRKKPVISLYELLVAFVNSKSHIAFLKRGDTFRLSNTQFEVLWPCFDCMKISGKTVKRTITTLSKLGFIKTPTGQEQISLFVDEDKNTIVIDIIDDFAAQLSSAFLMLYQTGTVDEKTMTQLTDTYNDLAKKCAAITLSPQTVTSSDLKSLGNSLVNQGNKLSIVFQDTGTKDFSKLLMTGDITKSELKKLILGKVPDNMFKIKTQYHLIKAPHHGTKSHFLPDLPTCDIITVSNGSTAHTKWGKIAFEYGALYGSNRHCKILCTNQRCELLGPAPKGNKCHNCSQMKQLYYQEHLRDSLSHSQ